MEGKSVAKESLVGLVVFGLLFVAFVIYAGSHRQQDHQPLRKAKRARE